MNTQHNALGLFGPAESALLALALKYEIVTGIHVKWRKSESAIFEMVKNSLGSDDSELFRKTTDFMDTLPEEARKKMSEFGIEYAPATATPVQTYRGAPVAQEKQRGQISKESEGAVKKKMWRGTAYS